MTYTVFSVLFICAFLAGLMIGFGGCFKAGQPYFKRLTFAIAQASNALEFLDGPRIVAHGLPDVANKISLARVSLDAVVDDTGGMEQRRTIFSGSPRRIMCFYCGAQMTNGVEPVSHGCCDLCLPDVLKDCE